MRHKPHPFSILMEVPENYFLVAADSSEASKIITD